MKEGRILIIGSIILSIIIAIISYILNTYYPSKLDYYDIARNLYYGLFMSLLTGLCQYFVNKRKIINNIYGYYFDIYRTHYYAKNKPILGHYNSYGLYKKIVELNSKTNESLDEYHGLFIKKDKTYKKLDPTVKLDNYKGKYIEKSFLMIFNKKYFNMAYEPLIKAIEKILIDINKKRFEKDKADMMSIYNSLWSNKNEK